MRPPRVVRLHSAFSGEVVEGKPGVRCGVLEQSAGLVWFEANRKPYRFAYY